MASSFSTNGNYSFVSTAKLGILIILDADEKTFHLLKQKVTTVWF